MTNLPARNTRISLIGLGVLAIAVFAMLAYHLDEWLIGGAALKKVTQTCDILGSSCTSAYSSILQIIGSPHQLLITMALAALALAIIKAVFVIIAARRMVMRYQSSTAGLPRVSTILKELDAEDIRIRVSDGDEVSAFTCGVFKPVICLSQGVIGRLSDEELTALIAHEVAHIRRRDNLAIFLALFVRDFLWALPISHYLYSIFICEKEYAADDYAVELTGKPVDLAGAIVSVAKAVRSDRALSPAYATFFSDKATAKLRVTRLLGAGDRVKPSAVRLLASLVISIAIFAGAIGIAYAQPVVKTTLNGDCKMGASCVNKNSSCCRSQ